MVTPEGLLPCRKIVNAYLEQVRIINGLLWKKTEPNYSPLKTSSTLTIQCSLGSIEYPIAGKELPVFYPQCEHI